MNPQDANPQESKSPVRSLVDFVSQCHGLSFLESSNGELTICQRMDGKHLTFKINDIEKVLCRLDVQNKAFLQVNFMDDRKMLLTDDLIGFKPVVSSKLDADRLPKVVTTPDLISFIDILENSLSNGSTVMAEDLEDVRQYFDSVLLGAEAIGFNLMCERMWIERLFSYRPTIGQA